MRLDRSFILHGNSYALKGVVYHYGNRPDAGHYVAAARHMSGFFLYDDTRRQEIPIDSIRSDTQFADSAGTIFHATALLYEKI